MKVCISMSIDENDAPNTAVVITGPQGEMHVLTAENATAWLDFEDDHGAITATRSEPMTLEAPVETMTADEVSDNLMM